MEQNKYKRVQEIEQDIKEYVEYLKFELGVSSGEIIFDEGSCSITFDIVESYEKSENAQESKDKSDDIIRCILDDMSEDELNDMIDFVLNMLS